MATNNSQMQLTPMARIILMVVLVGACALASFLGWLAIRQFTGPQATPSNTQVVINTPVQQTAAPNVTATSVLQATVEARATEIGLTAQPSQTPRATNAPNASAEPNATAQPTTQNNLPAYVVGFDAFAPYYNVILIKQYGLDTKYGFNLQLVPFCLTDDNCYDEATRTQKLTDGEWDGLLTTIDKLALHPEMGLLTAFVDETDGADKLICGDSVQSFNDLRGKRLSFLSESIGETFMLYVLKVVGITAAEVQLLPSDSVADAAQLYVDGQADCVSGWEPDVDIALDAGGHLLIGSHTMKVPLDVILTSNQAVSGKNDQVQAFHNAWFEALKMQFEDPAGAEAQIIAWGNPDWTFVASPGDQVGWLSTTPQASIGRNRSAMSVKDLVGQRLLEFQGVWAFFGKPVTGLDLNGMMARVESKYVLTAAQDPALNTSASPVNDSFQFTAYSDVPALDPNRDNQEVVLATLPLEKIPFQPESTRLTDEAKRQLDEFVIPVLRSSPETYLRLEGSAAWPGGFNYTEADILAFARLRAQAVADYLVDKGGFDPDRFIVTAVPPTYPQSRSNSELEQDRFVRFVLIALGR